MTSTLPSQASAAGTQAIAALLGHEVLLVTGKGGVGKSTVAQALARRAAGEGKKVLLVELEAISRAGPLLNVAHPGPHPQRAAANLDLAVMDTMDSLRYFATKQLRIEALVNLALRNRAVEGFFGAVPAVKPILFLYHIWQILEEHGPRGDKKYDLLICDLPTSGFVQGMYQIPRTLQLTFRAGPVHHYAQGMGDLLRDPKRCGLVLVTLPEEMPVVETLELQTILKSEHGVVPAAVVVNGVFSDVLDPRDLYTLAQQVDRPVPDAQAVEDALAVERAVSAPDAQNLEDLASWLWAAELLAGRRRRAETLLPRLTSGAPGRVLSLPFLFRRTLPLEAIDQLAATLGREVA
ncbi:MAG: hypothetical protein HY902_15700 [Deltaproteobacteria bacterium]|nr:hypothetical protein [Deltaproteobacteria bacterium]